MANIREATRPVNTRLAAIAYLASYLARAAFLPSAFIVAQLQHLGARIRPFPSFFLFEGSGGFFFSRAERRAARAHRLDGFLKLTKQSLLAPQNASPAPWSSTPSLIALYQLGCLR